MPISQKLSEAELQKLIPLIEQMKHKCAYGCGKEAKYQFKGGKWCCSVKWNFCPGSRKRAKESRIGKHSSEEAKKKISKFRKGRKASEETKRKMSDARRGEKNNMWGKCHSFETRKKIGLAGIGRQHSEETKKKISKAVKGENHPLWGKKHSEEARKRMSKAQKGNQNGLGYLHSEGTKKKMKKNHANFCGENHPLWGKFHTRETKKKIRITHIERRKTLYGQCSPNYNPAACHLLNKYAEENNLNIQHAENGGEFYISELGYWADGYDKEKNIIIEVDERFHFNEFGELRERDIQRQKEITKRLGCEFIRLQI